MNHESIIEFISDTQYIGESKRQLWQPHLWYTMLHIRQTLCYTGLNKCLQLQLRVFQQDLERRCLTLSRKSRLQAAKNEAMIHSTKYCIYERLVSMYSTLFTTSSSSSSSSSSSIHSTLTVGFYHPQTFSAFYLWLVQ